MLNILIATLISLGAFAVLLPLIVFVHEYGHFKVARLCGIRVEAFSIGFGRAIKSWTDKKGTVWKISAIPLGGYVKFFGDANAASAGVAKDEDQEKPITTQFNSERDRLAAMLTDEEKRVCFHFKPVWQRAAVVAAGPLANLLLALIIFAVMFMTLGYRTDEPVVGKVAPDSAAAEAGFVPGDRILAVNGARIDDFEDLQLKVRLSADTDRRFTVLRDGQQVDLVARPRRVEATDAFGNPVSQGQLGIELYVPPVVSGFSDTSTARAAGIRDGDKIVSVGEYPVFTASDVGAALKSVEGDEVPVRVDRGGLLQTFEVPIERVSITDASGAEIKVPTLGIGYEREPLARLGPVAATLTAADRIGSIIDGTLTYFGRLVTLREDPRQMGGPIKIAQYAGQAVTSGFDEQIEAPLSRRILISLTSFIQLAALISVSIGLLNLMPVPVLDGGHLVYYAYEAVAGRPLSDRAQGIGFRIGIVLVGTLMVFVVTNDLMQLF
ncbi:MAG: RIP metalloprotease RseP [Parvularcula sp.]